MNSKTNVHNFWRSHTFIILMFIVMSVISAAFMWHAHYVYLGDDLYFHIQRIYDLRASILNGNWNPLVSLNRFHQTGSAVMSLYPKINLYPMVLLSIVFKTFLHFYYITFILRNFFALVVAYVASYCYTHRKNVSFIFSITYVLTAIEIFNGIKSYDLGRSSSLIFLPLVMFGFMELVRRNRWVELTMGMSLIILCHVLNSAIVALFLLVLAAINVRKFRDTKKLLALGKATITTLLLTSSFVFSFFIFMTHNSIALPPSFWLLGGTSLDNLSSAIFENVINVNYSITLAMLLGLILGIVYYKKMSTSLKQLLWISGGFMILCSNLFPWRVLAQTSLNNSLQFSWRLYIIPEVILSYLFAEIIMGICKNTKKSNVAVIVITLSTLLIQIGAQGNLMNSSKNYLSLNSVNNTGIQNVNISSNYSIDKLIYNKKAISDYFPTSAVSSLNNISNHWAMYGKNKKIKVRSKGNGRFIFTNKKSIKKLSLPFLYYHGINYQVKLDGKDVKEYPNKSSLMTINNVRKGKHHVQIIVHKTKAEIASYILSLIGLLILLGTIIKNFLKKCKI